MRSRIVTGSVFLILLLAMVSTCRQRPQATTEVTAPDSPGPTSAAATSPLAPGTAASPTAQRAQTREATAVTDDSRSAGQTAVITADDPEAQINVRSQPSQTGDPIGYGRVGEPVVLGQAEEDPEGYTWHYVTFQNAATVGWIRSDLLDIQLTAANANAVAPESPISAVSQPPSDVLKRSLDDICGGTAAIESYFVTPSNTIYVCKVRNRRTYLSQETGTEQVVTADDVEALGGGYIISNGNFEYRLDSSSLVVVRFDDADQQEEVLREAVIYSERYE